LESSEEDLSHVLRVIRILAPVILKAVQAPAFHVTANTGEASGQSVLHTHFHIIPRFSTDGHTPWQHTPQTAEQLTQTQNAILHALTV
jgi:histidine triad (HIT) family protein